MKDLINKAKELGRKAEEFGTAIRQLPPKLGELREATASAKQQWVQLKSEIHPSAEELRATDDSQFAAMLREIAGNEPTLTSAGFALSGFDLEVSPANRLLLRLVKREEVHPSVLRSLIASNESRTTMRAILSSILQARQLADTIEMDRYAFCEVTLGVGPAPLVRLHWRKNEELPSSLPLSVKPASIEVAPPASPFGASSFFESRPLARAPKAIEPAAATPPPTLSPDSVQPATEVSIRKVAPQVDAIAEDPLARFKRMPDLSKSNRK